MSLTNLVCNQNGQDLAARKIARSVASADESAVLENGITMTVAGNVATLIRADGQTISSVVLAGEGQLGSATVTSSTVAAVNGLPVVSMVLSTGTQLQFDCHSRSCKSATVNVAHESVYADACTTENAGAFTNDAGVVSACTRLPAAAGDTSLFMWVPLGNNLQSHL